jgi:hypothetical protein
MGFCLVDKCNDVFRGAWIESIDATDDSESMVFFFQERRCSSCSAGSGSVKKQSQRLSLLCTCPKNFGKEVGPVEVMGKRCSLSSCGKRESQAIIQNEGGLAKLAVENGIFAREVQSVSIDDEERLAWATVVIKSGV